MELRILQYIDKMPYNEKLDMRRVENKDRFIQTVKDIIDMGWDLMCGYRIKISNDYSVIEKVKKINLDYSKKESIVKKFLKKK